MGNFCLTPVREDAEKVSNTQNAKVSGFDEEGSTADITTHGKDEEEKEEEKKKTKKKNRKKSGANETSGVQTRSSLRERMAAF